MSEKGVFGVQERFLGYSKPELLQIASYLAQHDVAFNNIPEYSTEGPGGQSVDDHKSELKIKKQRPKSPPAKSPPVRDTGVDIPPRKPLHAPTERQLNAAKTSHLRQLINKSKATLLKLDNEILAERSNLSLHRPVSEAKLSIPGCLPRPPAASSGVLKQCVRTLGVKRIRKSKRPVTTAKTPFPKASQVTLEPQAPRDARILSSYLKRLALETDAREPADNLQKTYIHQPKKIHKGSADLNIIQDYQKESYSPPRQQYPPNVVAFLEKWGSKLRISDVKEARGMYISFTHGRSTETSPESSSTSTDSIGEFIKRHTKFRKSHQNSKRNSTEIKQVRLKSPKEYKSVKNFRGQSTPMTINELKEDEAPFRTLRLPVEQHQKLLTIRRTAEVAHANRWNQSDLLSSYNSEENIALIQLCDRLAEEIVDSCIKASVNLVDSLADEVIDELLHNELAISASSSWSSFSSLAVSPQPRGPSNANQFIASPPPNPKTHHLTESKTLESAPKPREDPMHKSKLQKPTRTTPKMISQAAGLITPANTSTSQKTDCQVVTGGDSAVQVPEIRSDTACSSDHESMIAGDGSSIEEGVATECSNENSKQRSGERFSTPEEVRLKNSGSVIMPHKLTGSQQSIEAASGDSDIPIHSRVSNRKGYEPYGKQSSLQDNSVPLDSKDPAATSRPRSSYSQKSSAFSNTPNDSPLTTSDSLSTPKPVTIHNRVFSLDLVTSLTSSSIPEIDTPDVSTSSSNGTIQKNNTSPRSASGPSSHVYEDDFESTGIESN